MGHYHLGAALISQGELTAGLEHLKTAIQCGPPLAETHYMVAFTLLYQSADKLSDSEIVQRISHECEIALRLKPYFPEVHFLLGQTYYKQAQITEKTLTRIGKVTREKSEDNPRPDLEDYMSIYRNAQKHLKTTIRQCDRLISNLRKYDTSRDFTLVEQSRLMRDRMAATHRLADTLRSLRLYSEADSHYEDVIEAYPTDIRTLTDQAKTYCQAENWDRAIQYNWERLMSHPSAGWDTVPNLCLGWAISGGICDREATWYWVRKWLLGINVNYDRKQAFDMAVETMDYALLIRPRRVRRWQQTNWLPFYVKAAFILQTEQDWNTVPKLLRSYCVRFLDSILSVRYLLSDFLYKWSQSMHLNVHRRQPQKPYSRYEHLILKT